MEIEEMKPYPISPPPGARVRVSGVEGEPGLEGTGVVVEGAGRGRVRIKMDGNVAFRRYTNVLSYTHSFTSALVMHRPTVEVPTRCIEVISAAEEAIDLEKRRRANNAEYWKWHESIIKEEKERSLARSVEGTTEPAFNFEPGSNVVLDNFGAGSSSIIVHTGDGVRAKVTERDGRIIFEAHLDEEQDDDEAARLEARRQEANDQYEMYRAKIVNEDRSVNVGLSERASEAEVEYERERAVSERMTADHQRIYDLMREVNRLREAIDEHREAIRHARTIDALTGNRFNANARRVADDTLWSAASQNR
jgi:hypothetical protein